MRRRSFLSLVSMLPLSLLVKRFWGEWSQPVASHKPGEMAAKLDRLAGNIHTQGDARALVDFVAENFAQGLSLGWRRDAWLERVARAEFAAVSDQAKLIPEERIAAAWNGYVRMIGATGVEPVSAAEVHNLRDGLFTTARILKRRGSQNPWTVTAIYATTAEGRLAQGCRTVESARLLWDMMNMPENLASARERARQGVLFSDWFRDAKKSTANQGSRVAFFVREVDPLSKATRLYVRDEGQGAMNRAVKAMADAVLG